MRRVRDVEPLKQLLGAASPFTLAEAQQVGHEEQVLLGGEQVVERGELPGDADRGAHPVR
ncbi:hypothetical protein GCM10020000_78070 [Streptomyces olivoverticillatus]